MAIDGRLGYIIAEKTLNLTSKINASCEFTVGSEDREIKIETNEEIGKEIEMLVDGVLITEPKIKVAILKLIGTVMETESRATMAGLGRDMF